MKILFVVNWYTPNSSDLIVAGAFHTEQCKALQKHCDVRLYWPFDSEIEDYYANEENGLFVYRTPWSNKKKYPSKLLAAKKYFDRIIREYKPDIIHANCAMPCGFLCQITAKKYNIPMILTEHSPIEQMQMDNLIKRWIRGYTYGKMNRNICVSKDSMKRLGDYYPKVKYEVNYNAVMDPNTIEADGKQYRREGWVNACIVAVFYDKEIKGYQYLIPAIKKCKDIGVNILLHICGGGEYMEYYKQLVKELDIEDRVIFYGQCDRRKVYSIVRQADFCVSSSIFECSGVSVQEEMILGKPILVTRSGGANSLCTDYTAIVVDRKSTEALKDGLIEMAEKYSSFNPVQIKQYAYDSFEISNVTRRYLEIYKEELSRNEKQKK